VIDYDEVIVVIVQLEADISHVPDVSNLVSVEVEQELGELVHREGRLVLGQSHEG
jgi:hypothetical protein